MQARHILIIRNSAMGDVAMAVPVVGALREACPELRISILTRTPFRAFFQGIECLEFVDFEPKGSHKGIGGLWRLAREVKAAGVDTVADLHDVMRSRVIGAALRLMGCRVRHIRKGRLAKRLLTCRLLRRRKQLKTSVERYADVFRRLGFAIEPKHEPFRPTATLRYELRREVEAKEGAWIGIAPFAKHEGKIYPLDLQRTVIDLLGAYASRIFIFGGGKDEQEVASELEKRYPKVTSLVGEMSLEQEMVFMQSLDAMVTMDSSTMHIASIVGVPVVSIWGATHPYAGFYGFGQNPADAVQADMACRPCSVFGQKKCRYGDYRCMKSIKPETVANRVAIVLRRSK